MIIINDITINNSGSFKKIVENKINEKYNHTTYCLNSDKPGDHRYAEENCWLDPEGHSFSKGEFS